MILFFEILLFLSLGLIVYTYAIYPALLFVLASLKRESSPAAWKSDELPTVSVIMSVFNEEKVLSERIRNLLSADYPKEKIEFLFGSDASTDRSNEILSACTDPRIRVFLFKDRRGKAGVLNDLLAAAKNDVLVMTDSNTMYYQETIRQLVTPYADASIGAVCGRLILRSAHQTTGGTGEASYWDYENFIKNCEGKIWTTVGATGAVYSIRRELARQLPSDRVVMDDFLIPMNAVLKGYRIVYNAHALAEEDLSGSIKGEFKRKVRISAANFNAFRELRPLLNPFAGFGAFAFWSHKIIRWFAPFLLLIFFLSSIVLYDQGGWYPDLVAFEFVFLTLALIGYLAEKMGFQVRILGLPYYFLAVNVALALGFFKYLRGTQKAAWEVVR